jgi:hypothetical protein
VRRVLNEFLVGLERGDPGVFFDLDVVPNDYEFVLAEPIDLKPVWIGREEFVEFMRTWTGGFEDYSIQVERLIDAGGNRVVAVLRQHGTGTTGRRCPRSEEVLVQQFLYPLQH